MTATTIYVVCAPSWEYDDEYYHQAGWSLPSRAFATEEAAIAWAEANPFRQPEDDRWYDDDDEDAPAPSEPVFVRAAISPVMVAG